MRRRILIALAAFGIVATTAATAAAATLQYPDLRTLPPRDLRIERADVSVNGAGTMHNVLRFSNTTWNAGEGRLVIRAQIDPATGNGPATQRIYDDAGGHTDLPVGTITYHAVHQHYHYDDWGRYELWKRADWDTWVAGGRAGPVTALRGTKTTSCVLDEEFITTLAATPFPAAFGGAGCNLAADNTLNMGLSPGWGDTYDYYRFEQWVDLDQTSLADGDYVLRSVADPTNKVYESASKGDAAREAQVPNEAMTFFSVSAGKIVDGDAPSGTVTINDVAKQTTTAQVNVKVLGRDDVSGVGRVRVSNDGTTWSAPYAYSGSGSVPMSIAWDLSDSRYGGGAAKGTRTVYAEFEDRTGKWSAPVTDTIDYVDGSPGSGGTGSAYADAVLRDGAVSFWRLDETFGTTAADARGVNPGTYENDPGLGVASLLNSDPDRAVHLDGTLDDVRVADSTSLDVTNAVSVEAWIKPDALPTTGNWASVVSKGEAYSLQFAGPQLEFTIIQSGTRRRLRAPAGAVPAGRVSHVVGTYDGTTQRLYVNSDQVGSVALTGAVSATTNPLGIGAWDGQWERFGGTIDEAAVYGRALTGLDVKNHYDLGIAGTAGVPAPTGLSAAAQSSSQVRLTWNDNATNETGYVLQRDTNTSFTLPATIDLPAGTTSYTDIGRTASTTYSYRVKAVTSTDSSAWSAVAGATTQAIAAPTGLTASPRSTSQIDLAWLDNAANESGYVVERDTDPAFGSPVATNLPAGSVSLAVTGLSGATSYSFRIKAVDAPNSSPWSVVATAKTQDATTPSPPPTPPAAPAALTATATTSSSVDLAWTDNASDETGYVLQRDTDPAFPAPVSRDLPAGATSAADTGLVPSTTYWYRVKAVAGTLSSAWSSPLSAATRAASYRSVVLADAPAAYLRLGERSGTTAVDEQAAVTARYLGAPALGAASLLATDAANTAARFNGTSQGVRVNDANVLDVTSALTVEAWISVAALPPTGSWASVASKPDAYSLQFNGPRLEFTIIQSGARRRLLLPAGAITAGQTYHVVGTYDGATQRVYLDGVQQASRAQTGAVSVTTTNLNIATWDSAGEWLQGTVDEVAVYPRAIAAARVAAHFAAGKGVVAKAASRKATTKRRAVRRPSTRRSRARTVKKRKASPARRPAKAEAKA